MQEWYLMTPNTRPNITGGYENDALLDYKEDAFAEVLSTDMATDIILYNTDLTTSSKIRCVIQGNTADTHLKSMERTGLFTIGTIKAGMYVFYENRYWLIIGYPGNNGVYEKAVMVLCQYKLRWQNLKGDIVERWCNGVSAAKYDIGESGNTTITLSSNTFTILLPDDSETLELDGKRVFIDKNKVNPTKVYKITRSDDILYDYGVDYHGGVFSFIADKQEFNKDTDNRELGICDYHSPTSPIDPIPPNETPILSATISGSNNLKVGFERTYSVKFTDKDGNQVDDIDFEWKVISEFDNKVNKIISGNVIKIKIDDDSLVDESFLLQIIVNSEIVGRITIDIEEGF